MYTLRLLFCLVALSFLPIAAQAQIFETYVAREPVSDVLAQAAESMSSPQIFAVATADFETDGGDLPVPISSVFNFQTGEATGWLYVVRDADNTTTTSQFLVAKFPIFGFTILNAADFDIPIPAEFFDNITDALDPNWMDSDVMANTLRAHAPVQSFLMENPGLKPTVLGIWKDALLENTSAWTVFIGEFGGGFELPEDQPGMICQVNALNGDTQCLDDPISTSVAENDAASAATIAPNPAEDFVNVYLAPGVEASADRIDVRDINGRSVYTERLRGGNTYIPLEINRLAAGVYTVQVLDAAGHVVAHSMMVRR